jgi:hypothetical protein
VRGRKPRKNQKKKYVTLLSQCWSVLHVSSGVSPPPPRSLLSESFSSLRPSDAEFGLAWSSRCAVCSIAKVVILPRLCDFVMLGTKIIYF